MIRRVDWKLFILYFLRFCLSHPLLLCLSACLLYSRLVLNLQKFIRYKLLLPSYSFIAPHRTESSFCSVLFFSFLLAAVFTTVDGGFSFQPARIRSRIPSLSTPSYLFFSSLVSFALRPWAPTPPTPPGACSTSCSSRAVCFRVRK